MGAPTRGPENPSQLKTGKDYSPGNIPRDRWDRPLIVPPGGGKPRAYVRASTLGGALEYTGNLEDWRIRCALWSAAREADILLRLNSITDPHADQSTKRTMKELADKAHDRGGFNVGAIVGSALHDLGEILDQGGEIPATVPEVARATLAAYRRVAMDHFEFIRSEAFVVNDILGAAGTFDRQGRLRHPMRPVDGKGKPIGPWIGAGESIMVDVKTGQTMEYAGSKFAVQLKTYADGKLYRVDEAGNPIREEHGARRDFAVILHVPSGSELAELHWVDLRKVDQVAEACMIAREADKVAKSAFSPYVDVAPPSQEALLTAINGAGGYAHLIALWDETGGLWGPDLVQAATARLEALGGPPAAAAS